ncbi:MAG TPA: carboxypeptidase-like regulatory domain-containing protein, partial [Bryobacterales bacterium]|nr:carboxypeptidase-like regulatory domain-containing protein [Bryobacterales bacterium]
MATFRRFSLGCVLLLLSIAALCAQTIDTGILGNVTDATGAVVANAAVTITQPATGLARTVATNAEGYYEVRYLLPGEYTVEVRTSGFRTERQTRIVIQIGQQARINFAVQVGAVEERVDVVAEAPLTQTENAALGEVVSRERVVNLPLNGRRFIDLAALTPGVTLTTSTQYSILKTNGTRNTTMALSFDGASATT